MKNYYKKIGKHCLIKVKNNKKKLKNKNILIINKNIKNLGVRMRLLYCLKIIWRIIYIKKDNILLGITVKNISYMGKVARSFQSHKIINERHF